MGNYRRTSTVFQMETAECGAACLAMILNFFGKNLPLEQVRQETGISRDGCRAGDIMRTARLHGLECHGFRKHAGELRSMPMPCIIHWEQTHFVVLEGFRGHSVYINDPAVGHRRLSAVEFSEGYSGIVLSFRTTACFLRGKKKRTVSAFVRRRLAGYGQAGVELMIIGLLMVIPGAALPVLSGCFVDRFLIPGGVGQLAGLVIGVGLLTAMKVLLQLGMDHILQRMQREMSLTSARDTVLHILRLPMPFFEQRSPGDLVSRMHSNEELNSFLTDNLMGLLNGFAAVVYLGLLSRYSRRGMVIVLCTAALSAVLSLLSRCRLQDLSIRQKISRSRLYSTLCSGLGISDTLKASGGEDKFLSRILKYSERDMALYFRQIHSKKVIDTLSVGIEPMTQLLLLAEGGIRAMDGYMSFGAVTVVFGLYGAFQKSIATAMSAVRNLSEERSDIQRVEDVLKYPEDSCYTQIELQQKRMQKLSGEVELRNVSFGYSSRNPVLIDNFCLHLRCGESAAVVGYSGCGKSTLSKLVSGLYQPDSGQILLDGIPAEQIPRWCKTASIATVSQNINLFSGSIRDNLTMWNPAVRDEDMLAAAKDACIHDFIISRPGGYDSMLSENAQNISGGQRQRLEIARALAVNPSILILDEATSALDPIVEHQIMQNIRRRGCTLLIAAHRLSAIRDCGTIMVMEAGRIVQQGSHEMLMKQKGLYRDMVNHFLESGLVMDDGKTQVTLSGKDEFCPVGKGQVCHVEQGGVLVDILCETDGRRGKPIFFCTVSEGRRIPAFVFTDQSQRIWRFRLRAEGSKAVLSIMEDGGTKVLQRNFLRRAGVDTYEQEGFEGSLVEFYSRVSLKGEAQILNSGRASDEAKKKVQDAVQAALNPGKIEPSKSQITHRALPEKKLTTRDILRFCGAEISPKDLLAAAGLSFTGVVLSLFLPFFCQVLFDRYLPMGHSIGLKRGCLAGVAFLMGSLTVSILGSLLPLWVGQKAGQALQNAASFRLLHLPASFFRRFSGADLGSRVVHICETVSGIADDVMTMAFSTMAAAVCGIVMHHIAPTLFSTAMAVLLLFSMPSVFLSICILRKKEGSAQAEAEADGRLYQYLCAVDKIRMAGSEEQARLSYILPYINREKEKKDASRLTAHKNALRAGVPGVLAIALFGAAAGERAMTFGSLASFTLAFGMFAEAWVQMGKAGLRLYQRIKAAELFRPIFETVPETGAAGESLGEFSGGISLEHVSFSYEDNGKFILCDLTLEIRPGEYVGIVGASGCGKSTLLKLLMGFEDPQIGAIRVEGKNLSTLDKSSYRRQLGVVLQHDRLVPGSVLENLTMTAPNVSRERFEKVLSGLELWDDLAEMPMGIHTMLTEKAETISGGQLQRILLARALMGNPKLLILDEATGSLDDVSQQTVREYLDRLPVTRIVVAHRLSTIKNCNRILVMDQGRIVEEGNFEALMEKQGLFYTLASRQIACEVEQC